MGSFGICCPAHTPVTDGAAELFLVSTDRVHTYGVDLVQGCPLVRAAEYAGDTGEPPPATVTDTLPFPEDTYTLAVKKMKKGKAVGPDGIPVELYKQ